MELQAKLTTKIDDIQRKLRECNYECNRLKEFVEDVLPDLLAPPAAMKNEGMLTPPVVAKVRPVLPPETKVPQDETPESIQSPATETPETPSKVPPAVPPVTLTPPLAKTPVPPRVPKPEAPRPPVRSGAKQVSPAQPKPEAPSRNLEEFIGGNLLNKIGIGILVIGVGIFVKYAIDQDWIGSVGRVLIGLLTGGLLLGIAHSLRKKYAAFSSVLLGGGLATLYFTVAIAFHIYGLLGQTAAFSIMVLITGSAVFFALAYDRREIGVLALLGGFATPFMASNGDGNYVTLFSYVLVLNLGFLVMSWYRDWKIIRVLSYGMTLLLVGGMLGRNVYLSDYADLGGMLTFTTIFFVVFFAMNIAFNVKANKPLGGLEYIMVLSNSMFYYAAGMAILHYIEAGAYMGLFTALLGAFHFAFIYPVRKLLASDKNLSLLLIGVVLTLITLAIPIQLKGNYITLFWAGEAVILIALSRKSRIGLLLTASQVVSILAVIGLGWDWSLQYFGQMPSGRTPIVNGAFLTSMLTAAAMIVLYFIYKQSKEALGNAAEMSKIYQFISLPLLYLGGLLELMDQSMHFGSYRLSLIAMATYTALYLCAMQLWAIRDRRVEFGRFISVLSAIFFVLFVYFNFGELTDMREGYLRDWESGQGFAWHLVMLPAVLGLLGLNLYQAARTIDLRNDMGKIVLWLTSGVFIVIASMELDHLMVMAGFPLKTAHKVGYPILWGATAFGMILLGMRKGLVSLRIGGLVLFCLILVKLFVYDIREVPTGGKIAAFISLGVLLLVISFMYQRLRKLLFEN